MRTLVGYSRISTEDQSKWSIPGQQQLMRDYAARNGDEVVKWFVDDGYTAANFDRPGWIALMHYIASRERKVDAILVANYDRMARNLSESLLMVEKLRRSWKVEILSVNQDLGMSPDNPFAQKIRNDFFSFAEFERMMIKHRTSSGQRQARKEGRFIGSAPVGYTNARDAANKPIIIRDETMAPIVAKIFGLVADGHDFAYVRKMGTAWGIHLKGKMWLQKMLSRVTYIGKVEYKEGDEIKIAHGRHEAIVEESTFWTVQQILKTRLKRETKRVERVDALFLKGVLQCINGHLLTHSGEVVGRHGHRYQYYLCNTCRKENHLVKNVHRDFEQMIESMALPAEFVARLQSEILRQLDERLDKRQKTGGKLRSEIRRIEKQLLQVEEKFISDEITSDVYQRWMARYNHDLSQAREQLQSCGEENTDFRQYVVEALPRISELSYVMQRAGVIDKQDLLMQLFPGGLVRHKKGFRSPLVHPLFAWNASNIKCFEETGEPQKGDSPVGSGMGDSIYPLLQLVARICA